MMLPHQQRVIAEKTDLDAKIVKLTAFLTGEIYPTLPQAEQARLTRQLNHMRDYSLVLNERIAGFGEA